MNDIQHKIRGWLERPENLEILEKVVRRVIKACISRNLSFQLLGRHVVYSEIDEDMIREVRSRLIVFILENKIFHKALAHRIKLGFTANLGQVLINSFINRLHDSARSHADIDRTSYLYKRIYTVLKDSELFHLSVDKNGHSIFSMAKECPPPESLDDQYFEKIDFPDRLVVVRQFDAINNKQTLLALAEYFWKNFSEIAGNNAVSVYIRDFRNWLTNYIPMEHLGFSNVEKINRNQADHGLSSATPYGPRALVRENLKKSAEHFFHHLNDKQRSSFYFIKCLGLTLKESSRKMGLGGASAAGARLDRATEALKKFIMTYDIAGLGPDDLDEDLFFEFIDFLCALLEKSGSTP